MDKDGIYALQRIDCNCNNCGFMKRDIGKFDSFNDLYGYKKNASWRINYGNCLKFDKPVSFIPDTCQLETQHCFIHRKDYTHNKEIDNKSKLRLTMTELSKEDYIPFGNEWEREMAKFPKAKLIKMLGSSLRKNADDQQAKKEAIAFTEWITKDYFDSIDANQTFGLNLTDNQWYDYNSKTTYTTEQLYDLKNNKPKNTMKKYDKVFIPVHGTTVAYTNIRNTIRLENVIVLTERELIQLFKDFLEARDEIREFMKLKGLSETK